jgi:hypothetical protein
LQGRAEQLLLNALDGEALYTIASDIKPMSSGIEGFYVEVAAPATARSDCRGILPAWTCGDRIQASVYGFAAVRDGSATWTPSCFGPRAAAVVASEPAFFGTFGLTANAARWLATLDGTPAISWLWVALRVSRARRFLRPGGRGRARRSGLCPATSSRCRRCAVTPI